MLVLRLVMRVLRLLMLVLVLVLVLMLVLMLVLLMLNTSSFGRTARSDGHAHGDSVGLRVSLHMWVDVRMSRRLALISGRLWNPANMLLVVLLLLLLL
jgi:hypothetical protein